MLEIRRQADLGALGLTNDPWLVDFRSERLIIKNSDLQAQATAQVRADDTAYYLIHASERDLLIGNTFTQPGLLWMVVPRDGRKIRLGRQGQARVCDLCRSGAVITMRRIQSGSVAP